MREALWRVRPSLAICGHVHEGRGAERILWDLDCPNVRFKESATGYWTDPGLGSANRKQCHLDLSGKSSAPLNGTGSWIRASDGIDLDGLAEILRNHLSVRNSLHSLAWTPGTSKSGTSISGISPESSALETSLPEAQDQDDGPEARSSETVKSEYDASNSDVSSVENRFRGFGEDPHVAEDRGSTSAHTSLESGMHSAIRGQGGTPPSGRCDLEALAGRRGRKETCVINASIMASSWPYKFKNGRNYNKPIIVDIDLPVWQDSE